LTIFFVQDIIFLFPLDDRREWYRYHNLLADFLREELSRRAPEQAAAQGQDVRCYIACMGNDLTGAEEYAGQALRDLSEEDTGFKPGIYVALGDTYRQNGQWAEARQSYLVALESINDPENWGRLSLPVTGWIYTRTAELYFEWDELEEASGHLARGLERAGLSGDVRTQIAGVILSARLALAQGDLEKAAEALALLGDVLKVAEGGWGGGRTGAQDGRGEGRPAAAGGRTHFKCEERGLVHGFPDWFFLDRPANPRRP